MRAKHLTSAILAAALAFSASACGDDDKSTTGDKPKFKSGTTMAKLQKDGKIRVGTKFDQPLFGQKNPTTGKVEGFDVEIAKIIAKELGLDPESDIEYTESISKNREPFIEAGKVDIVVATYTINDTRKEKVSFAGPYYVAGQDILVNKDDTSVTGVDSLAGKKVCSVEGSTSEKNIKEKAPQAQLTVFDTYTKCIEAMKDGRVVATSTDNVILLGLIDKNPGLFKLVGNTFTQEPYGIGMKKDDTDFRTFVNDVLEKAYQDGRWAAAFAATAGKVATGTPVPPPVNRY